MKVSTASQVREILLQEAATNCSEGEDTQDTQDSDYSPGNSPGNSGEDSDDTDTDNDMLHGDDRGRGMRGAGGRCFYRRRGRIGGGTNGGATGQGDGPVPLRG